MRVYWCHTCGAGRNFGDQLTPVLLRHFGVPVTWARPPRCDLICVGSVLSKVPNGWTGTVLGTGFILPSMRKDLSHARVLGVRGELTRRRARLPRGTVLGDPGILVGDLLDDLTPSEGSPAILPHYVDHDMARRHPGLPVINIRGEPREVIRQIASASVLYTSSLHGLIAADALGVPHVLELSRTIGGLFKFLDYASAFGEVIRPGRKRLTARRAMADRQAEIRGLFIGLDNMQ